MIIYTIKSREREVSEVGPEINAGLLKTVDMDTSGNARSFHHFFMHAWMAAKDTDIMYEE